MRYLSRSLRIACAGILLTAGCAYADPQPEVTPEQLAAARHNGALAQRAFHGTHRFMDGWLTLRRGEARLIPENVRSQEYRPENSGADNYPFVVISAWMTDPAEFKTSSIDMLNSEIANASRALAADKPAVLPDFFHLDRNRFSHPKPDLYRATFGSCEYVKDGLITITELLGPHDNPWYDRMVAIVDYMWEHHATRPSDHGEGLIEAHPLLRSTFSYEAHGENLQVLPRLYWQTGKQKYLDWANRLGDHYLIDGPQYTDYFHPTHANPSLRAHVDLIDHGNEIIAGLVELYATHSMLARQGNAASAAKVAAYREPIYKMLDFVLKHGRNDDGVFYWTIATANTATPGAVVNGKIPPSFGYVWYAFSTAYLIDKDSDDPDLRKKVEHYREQMRMELKKLPERKITFGGHEDSIEGVLNLFNREQDLDTVAAWLDSEALKMFASQRPTGRFRNNYSDGNYGRSLQMYALWKTRGVYELLEAEGYRYAIRLKANPILERHISHMLKRPVGRPPNKPQRFYHSFEYQAQSWDRPRRVVAKVEWHQGELFPRVGFIVTNLTANAPKVVHFYNQRGTAEQWIKEGKYAVNWTRLSCRSFAANQVRLQLHVLAYNLGNFLRRIALPPSVKHWSLTTLRDKLIKIGAKMVHHARYVTFQLAEVAIPRRLYRTILDRIRRFAAIPPRAAPI